eukprot:1866534-Amphidinium_carterae.1
MIVGSKSQVHTRVQQWLQEWFPKVESFMTQLQNINPSGNDTHLIYALMLFSEFGKQMKDITLARSDDCTQSFVTVYLNSVKTSTICAKIITNGIPTNSKL